MQIILKTVPKCESTSHKLRNLKVGSEAGVLPLSKKNSLYVTLNRLKKTGLNFITKTEGDKIFVWRLN